MGSFFNLFSEKGIKVKELIIINPKKGMSFQRHFYRSEIWFLSKGSCLVKHKKQNQTKEKETILKENDFFQVKQKEWHQIINPFDQVCKIIEIQYGKKVRGIGYRKNKLL